MAWLRDLLRSLAADGRTILVSSHVLSELEQIADQAVVIHNGRLITSGPVAELSAAAGSAVLVRSPDADRLARLLRAHGTVEPDTAGLLRVTGLGAAEIAELAAAHGLRVHELTPQRSSLEQVFLALTTCEQGADR